MRILTVALIFLIPFSLYASARSDSGGLVERVAQLEAQVAAMEEILQYVHVETGEINYLAGPHWIIEGANVHVRSGSGRTGDGCEFGHPDDSSCESLTGLGNLIVGYNERRNCGRNFPCNFRSGSHNLVVGPFQDYISYAGFVAGAGNKLIGANASICGGAGNEASGAFSSVSGGHTNRASGTGASVGGGENREAPDDFNWAAGSLVEEN